jgi:hypothetical protein
VTSNNVYEIHRYQHDNFEYVVARTNKYTEEQVKNDVERMNEMLNDEARSQGIRYVFAVGSTSDTISSAQRRFRKEEKNSNYFFERLN